MKILIFLLLAIPCLSQDRYLKESEIENTHIKKGIVLYDTLEKGQGGAFRFILTDFGTVDTTKLIIIKYEAFQIDTGDPVTQVDTVDGEGLTYVSWARHGFTSAAGWYKRTISYSNAGEASYTFTGTKIEVFGERGLNNGTATITIKHPTSNTIYTNLTTTADLKGTQLLPFRAAVIPVPRATYTVTIKPNGDGNILIDYLVIHK